MVSAIGSWALIRHGVAALLCGGLWLTPAAQSVAQTTAQTAAAGETAMVQLDLAPAVRDWLRAHRVLRVGVVRDWRPVDGVDAEGAHTGASADVLAQVGSLLGVQVRPVVLDDFGDAIPALEHGHVDLLSSLTRTPSREERLLFTESYLSLPAVYIARRGVHDFAESGNFGGRTLAVEAGYAPLELFERHFPAVKRLVVPDTLAALRAVAEKRADFYRGTLLPAHYIIERELLANLEVVLTDPLPSADLCFGTKAPELQQALDAALRLIGPARLRAMAQRWEPDYLSLTYPRRQQLPSSAAVGALGELRVAYDASFGPFSRTNPDGGAAGLSVDLFQRAAAAVGIRYRFLPFDAFDGAIEALRGGRADVVIGAVRTPERLRYASFVGPYYSSPSTIVSRLGQAWSNIAALAGHTLAIDDEHYLIPFIGRTYPGVRLKIVRSATDVLEAVANGEADAGVTNVEVAASLIGTRYAGRLQLTGLIGDQPSALNFMIRGDRPEVAAALKAGFDAVPSSDRHAAANAALRTTVNVGLDWRDVLMVVVPLVSGLVGLLLGAVIYANRLRRTQAQLRLERDHAHQAAEAKAAFLAEMGHEVRTPLAALGAGLRMMTDTSAATELRDLARVMLRSADRILALLNNLLDMARFEAGKLPLQRQPIDAGVLVAEASEQFRPLAQSKGVDLVVNVPLDLPPLMIDPQRARQVVNNLLSNALKFTDQGEVRVSLTATDLHDGTSKLYLRVRDTGTGMSRTTREQLFQRFAQAPGALQHHGGSGLGLAIAHAIMKQAGGSIRVDSEPGRGSEFIVEFCATRASAETATSGVLSIRRVLLVDDDPVNLMVFAELLKSRGFQVDRADHADKAVACLTAQRYDMLLTDVDLGAGSSGLELARRARQLDRQAPGWVLVLSGKDEPATLPPGVDRWLLKPREPGDRGWLDTVVALAGIGANEQPIDQTQPRDQRA